ncbi:efflux RND transporter periplasmic adaptor subunit [Lacibacter luteus]|uniref:Efflux RND transporter periplasmic adaptor subunit n=1 Tax=Lacibacter luteus TaxID=2508719 RepID=A0A4Q1CJ52_9BACT|nr:efflux RND transporter periplasmic adaptor subunit [Lacibacter luteus]RXK60583.1 efflux RND transporter periplasmic adaptor subunit [Lacibacter luteus]
MKPSMIIRTLSIAATALLVLAACKDKQEKETKKTEAAISQPAITVFTLQKDSMNTTVRIPGELIAFQQVDLYAKVNSFVKKLMVDVGSEVSAGQLLATLEAPEMNSQLSAAASRVKMQEAVYVASKATYNRLFETSKTPGTISPQDLELAYAKQQSDKALMDAAKAQYSEIAETRNYLQLRAPFSGVITARNVSSGAYVGPSGRGSEMPVFTLQEQTKLRLVVSIPEAQATYLNNKHEVKFTVRSLTDTFTAKIARQSGALDNRLRSERIEMDVQNKNKKLLPGMVAEVIIPLNGNESTFVVPSSAVLNSTLGVFVIKVVDKKTIWVPVTVGRVSNGRTEVFGPLSVNDTLVTTVTEEIRNGAEAGVIKL